MARCAMMPVAVVSGDDDAPVAVAMLGCTAGDESGCPGLHADLLHGVWWTADPEVAARILELLGREAVSRG